MVRNLLLAAAALVMTGAARPATVDYRLAVEPIADAPPLLDVEIRLRGDSDGETVLNLPDAFASTDHAWRYVSDLTVKGAQMTAPDPAHRVLRHRPNAKLTIRYRVQSAYPQDPRGDDGEPYRGPLIRPEWFAVLGDFVFATPAGREDQPATFAWGRLPADWRAASDLEHGAMGRPMSVADVRESITMGGAKITLVERPIRGGVLRVAGLSEGPVDIDSLADDVARTVTAERTFWDDLSEPYFVVVAPLTARTVGTSAEGMSTGGRGRGDGLVLYAASGTKASLNWTIAHEHTHTWIPRRVGVVPDTGAAQPYWLTEGFTDFFTQRALLRAGLTTPQETVVRMDRALKAYDLSPAREAPAARVQAEYWSDPAVRQVPHQRGQLLALKWDEDIRRKSGGKLDLDDVILRMRDHYQRFAPGHGPDLITGLVSAAWSVAGLDLRPDIARYADGGAVVTLPEILFDGCLDARVTVSPGFDSGFDHIGSFAGRTVRGVRRGGPAWNSGLRNGMTLDIWRFTDGDMNREIELTVRSAGRNAKPRKLRFWPYGDADVETRNFQLAVGLSDEEQAACGRKIGGL